MSEAALAVLFVLGIPIVLIALLSATALASRRLLAARSRTRSVDAPTTLPSDARPDLIVVLGCPPQTRAGRPSRFLVGRASAAIDAYRALGAPRILCSGRGGAADADEVHALFRLLTAAGIPETAIVLDDAALRTLDTLDYLAARHPSEHVLLVSQAFHLPRVLFLARARRLDAWGLAAPGPIPGWRTRLREDLGLLRALFDVGFGRGA